jgi:hypothetical protein
MECRGEKRLARALHVLINPVMLLVSLGVVCGVRWCK